MKSARSFVMLSVERSISHTPGPGQYFRGSGAKHPCLDGRKFYVYLMSNTARTLYAGMTNDLARRVTEHKRMEVPDFTARYKLTHLVYAESTDHVLNALERAKQIKAWSRRKKVELIESINPDWRDLAQDLGVTDSSLRSE